MLIETAVGDAYGAIFEYADEMQHLNDLSGYNKHPTHALNPGDYSDDTQMSLAIAEVMLADLPWTKESLADRFVTCFKRDPIDCYARGFQALLGQITNGTELLAAIKPDSDKSGGAMRAGPIGYVKDVKTVMAMADLQAQITHNTPDGRAAAVAAALMNHYFLYRVGAKDRLGLWLQEQVPKQVFGGYNEWNTSWVEKVRDKGWMDVRAAVTAIRMFDSMSDILRFVVGLRGDTDTAAAITMSAASCSTEIKQDLPAVLIQGLRGGTYGGAYLMEIDTQLRKKYGFEE